MKVSFEIDKYNLGQHVWGGGRDTVYELTLSEIEKILSYLEGLYPEGMTITELNEFLWSERNTIAILLGYDDYDELINDKRSY